MSPQAPKYVYKLVPSSSPIPEPLPEALPVSDLDQRSGFIHLSTALQVPNTLRHFFKDEPSVYVLRIEYERVEKDIRWEDPDAKVCGPRGGEGLFPVRLVFRVCQIAADSCMRGASYLRNSICIMVLN